VSVGFRRIDRGRGHTYLDDAGRKLTGVTTVLKTLPKDALINWAAGTTAEYAVDHWEELSTKSPSARLKAITGARWSVVREASAKGTRIHALADELVRGGTIVAPPELMPYVDGYARWLDATHVETLWTEAVVGDPGVGVCGTVDLGIRWPDGTTEIADIKTGKGVYDEVRLQLAAYRYMPTMMIDGDPHPMPKVDRAAVLHVTKEGTYHHIVEAGTMEYYAFTALLEVYHWLEECSGGIAEPTETGPLAKWWIVEPSNDVGDEP